MHLFGHHGPEAGLSPQAAVDGSYISFAITTSKTAAKTAQTSHVMHLAGLLLVTSAVAAVTGAPAPASAPAPAPAPVPAPVLGTEPNLKLAPTSGEPPHALTRLAPHPSPTNSNSQRPSPEPKYFHEAGNSDDLSHYDSRYYTGQLGYDEHRGTLRHLIRSYLTACARLGIETWLAHGTLLGHRWNGRVMPWDSDLDVQLSLGTLDHLATHHNGTYHAYTFYDEAGTLVEKTYLLDVNPYYVKREKGFGRNVIDARWVDTSNGLFVDITALAELDPVGRPGIVGCKNRHFYRIEHLFPLHEAIFEGVPALVPNDLDRILVEEYGLKSLVLETWKGHYWHKEQKEWLKGQPEK